jgi:hypothetical protein
MPSFAIFVMQDGADFYVYRDSAQEHPIPSLNRTAPFKVLDYDMDAATRARDWFVNLCSRGQTINWIGAGQ